MQNDFKYVLDSTREDKFYEYFWLTFKNDILEYIDISIKDKLDKLSKELNDLQNENKYKIIYNKINIFIKENINNIINNCIKYNNSYKATHLIKNIKRYIKLESEFSFILNNENYKILFSALNSKKKCKYIFKEYYKYLESNNIVYINNIFEYSIKYKYINIIDIFKKKVNLELYLKKNLNKPIEYFQNISSKKLYKYFKKE